MQMETEMDRLTGSRIVLSLKIEIEIFRVRIILLIIEGKTSWQDNLKEEFQINS